MLNAHEIEVKTGSHARLKNHFAGKYFENICILKFFFCTTFEFYKYIQEKSKILKITFVIQKSLLQHNWS